MPSSFSGCCGIKPSYGLVPYTGALAIEQSVDHLGPMAATSADCALLLDVLAGYDGGLDPRQPRDLTPKPYHQALEQGVQGLRIGIVKEGFGTAGAEADVDDMVAAAARRFNEAGAAVEDVSVPVHAGASGIMFASILDGTLATFIDSAGAGPNPKGHSMMKAIRYYDRARRDRADDFPVTVKTVLLFATVMRERLLFLGMILSSMSFMLPII